MLNGTDVPHYRVHLSYPVSYAYHKAHNDARSGLEYLCKGKAETEALATSIKERKIDIQISERFNSLLCIDVILPMSQHDADSSAEVMEFLLDQIIHKARRSPSLHKVFAVHQPDNLSVMVGSHIRRSDARIVISIPNEILHPLTGAGYYVDQALWMLGDDVTPPRFRSLVQEFHGPDDIVNLRKLDPLMDITDELDERSAPVSVTAAPVKAAETETILVLSTGHVTFETAKILNEHQNSWPEALIGGHYRGGCDDAGSGYDRDYGWFLHVPDEADEEKLLNCPEDLLAVFTFARQHNARYVMMDRDGFTYDELPVYDW